MRDYLKRSFRFFAWMTLISPIVGFLAAWSAGLGVLLFLFVIPAAFIGLIAGAILWTIRGVKLRLEREHAGTRIMAVVTAPLFFPLTLFTAWPLLATGSFVGSFTRLIVNRSHYEAIITKVRANPRLAWFERDGGVTYSLDKGPPVRIAFNPEGMFDNWSGIIYDPTGDVMLAGGFDSTTGKFFAPDRITKLFEGDLVSCHHLLGSYYICSFT